MMVSSDGYDLLFKFYYILSEILEYLLFILFLIAHAVHYFGSYIAMYEVLVD